MSTDPIIKRLCVFCGSSQDVDPQYLQAARLIGQTLAKRGIGVVYGGGDVGMMGQVAKGAMESGGEVFGIIPQKLMQREIAHMGLTELFVVDNLRTRKAMMATMSAGFLTLPGGLGTFEELFEVATLTQLGYHHKPVGMLNIKGYFEPLKAFLEHAADVGFVRPQHRNLIHFEDTLDALLAAFEADLRRAPAA